jgi:hypothetical protein
VCKNNSLTYFLPNSRALCLPLQHEIYGYNFLKPEDQASVAFCVGKKASAVAKPPTAPAAAAGPNGGAEAAQGGKRKGAPQSGGKPKASMAPAKKAKTVAVSVADLDSRPHLELGVSSVEYAKAKKVGLLLQARANLCV